MWRRQYANNDEYWDGLPARLYEQIFGEADNVTEYYRNLVGSAQESHPAYNNNNTSWTTFDNYQSSEWHRFPRGADYESPWSHRSYMDSQIASDEAIARQLQEMEGEFDGMSLHPHYETSAGFTSGREVGGSGDSIDPDRMTYEQLSELDRSIGRVSTGLSEEQLSLLPSHKHKPSPSTTNTASADNDKECVICKTDFESGDMLTTLPCAHKYHEDCIKSWLRENKACCICKVGVFS